MPYMTLLPRRERGLRPPRYPPAVTQVRVRILLAAFPVVTLIGVALFFTFGYHEPLPRPDQAAVVNRSDAPMWAGTTKASFDAARRLDPHTSTLAVRAEHGELVRLPRCTTV